MRQLIYLAVLVAGCGASGVPLSTNDDERAMAIVWEQTYKMDVATRPSVQWHDECRTTDSTGDRVTSIKNGCVVAVVHANGVIELQRSVHFSDGEFALALEQWRQWLEISAFAPIDGQDIARANNALETAGL